MEDTIAAVATPMGRGALSIVRLSGPEAGRILAEGLAIDEQDLRPGRVRVGQFQAIDEKPVDRVVASFFKAPNSYTGEDVAEISCHGSPVITEELLEACLGRGGRLARPGEFTLRAFLNGKIDLPQAEAVRDLVESQTRFQAEVARQQLEGRLAALLGPVREELIEVLVELETAIEFVEEDVQPETREKLAVRLARRSEEVQELVESYRIGSVVQEGLSVVLAGKPNSGKSSIFNGLSKVERAIVTATPGTTRDVLRERLDLDGIPVWLIDTAGIREARDLVEQEGVSRSLGQAQGADLVAFVLDGETGFEPADERIWETIRRRPVLLVWNKADLAAEPKIPEEIKRGSEGEIAVSAISPGGLGGLAEAILQAVLPGGIGERERPLITNMRQRHCLESALSCLRRGKASLLEGASEEFVAYDLRKALDALGHLVGETTNEEILAQIFSTFCVGK